MVNRDKVGIADEKGGTVPIDNTTTAVSELLEHGLPEVSPSDSGYIEEQEPEPDTDLPQPGEPSEPLEESDPWRGRMSSKGDRFIPELHEFPPRELKSGKWAKKRGRKQGGKNGEQAAPEKLANPSAETRKHAETLAFVYGDFHRAVYGSGGRVESVEDIAALASAFELYMQTNGDIVVSPGWAVLFNMFGYTRSVVARKENEKINEKIKKGVVSVFNWLFKRKKKDKEEASENAQSDIRD